jgi:hypothetical protein
MKISRGESLDRYYLLKLFGFGIFLHKIHSRDPEGFYHNHPWNGISFIFGEYLEEKIYDRFKFSLADRKWWNYIDGTHHNVSPIFGPVWTLFIHWPRCRQWTVVNDRYEVVATEPWRGDVGLKDYSKV